MSTSISSAQYRELLENDWHPSTRDMYEQLLRRAIKREELAAKLGDHGDHGRSQALTFKRQQEAVREMRFLRGLQFEATAWRDRETGRVRSPLQDAADHACQRKQTAIAKRLRRAREEAAAGCVMQINWLKDHAELIAAVESYRRG